MAKHKLVDGRYQVPIVDLGNRLRDNFGLNIVEHPEFGGVTNVHAKNSHHYHGEAIDIQDWRDDNLGGVHWKDRTKNLEALLKGSGNEVIGPGSGDPGHGTHLHLGAYGGMFNLNEQQYSHLFGGNAGGQSATFAPLSSNIADDGGGAPPPPTAPIAEAKDRTEQWAGMSKAALDAEYDKIRQQPGAAQTGMEMHKAYFNK